MTLSRRSFIATSGLAAATSLVALDRATGAGPAVAAALPDPAASGIDHIIVVMMENHRSGLLWRLFMSCPEVQEGLRKLGFSRRLSALKDGIAVPLP